MKFQKMSKETKDNKMKSGKMNVNHTIKLTKYSLLGWDPHPEMLRSTDSWCSEDDIWYPEFKPGSAV